MKPEDHYLLMDGRKMMLESKESDYMCMSGRAKPQNPEESAYLMMKPGKHDRAETQGNGGACITNVACSECGCHKEAAAATTKVEQGKEGLHYMEVKPGGGEEDSLNPSPTARKPPTEYVKIDMLATQAIKDIGDQREQQRRNGSPYSANP